MSSSHRSRGLLLLSLLGFVEIMSALDCGENEIEIDGVRCCSVCPPGQGVVAPCTATSDTQCQPCELRSTFSSSASQIDTCEPCTECGDNAQTISECSRSHDRTCECNDEFFVDPLMNLCRPCDLCPMGHGAVMECTKLSNVRCRRCPNGTFSDRRSRRCVPCGVCGFHQLILRPCTNMENTICIDIPIPKVLPTNSTEITKQEYHEESPEKRDVLPIYCSVLGLVLVGLVIYVIISHVRRKKAQSLKKQIMCSTEDIQAVPRTNTKQGSDSGVCVEQDAKYAMLSSRVSDLPYGKSSQVEIMLMTSPDGRSDWKAVAMEVGYSPEHIANFELWANQDRGPPARYFMSEWSQTEHATVGALLRVLRTLGREDIVRVLQTDLLPREPRVLPSNQEPLLV